MPVATKPKPAEAAVKKIGETAGMEKAKEFVESIYRPREKALGPHTFKDKDYEFDWAVSGLSALKPETLAKLKPIFEEAIDSIGDEEGTLFLYWAGRMAQCFGDRVQLYEKAVERVKEKWGEQPDRLGHHTGEISNTLCGIYGKIAGK